MALGPFKQIMYIKEIMISREEDFCKGGFGHLLYLSAEVRIDRFYAYFVVTVRTRKKKIHGG